MIFMAFVANVFACKNRRATLVNSFVEKKVCFSVKQLGILQHLKKVRRLERLGPPPDLPSLLLHNRIIYLGMPLLPAVTELIIAEFLYLQYESGEKPIYLYINSTGTSNPDGSTAGFETEAFAVCDTMRYVKPPVHTICVGQAYGTAALLLAAGEKGFRAALPHATVMLHQPRSSTQGPASDIAIKAREVLYNRKVTFELLKDEIHDSRGGEGIRDNRQNSD
ncbi:Putative ATP-dependent Clp protease proteolytic subunit [Galdieria sulphuraria]|nr:Putative ATP-dependent Clp protease proteolytic subunit [Galdieria sulphuraria]